MPDISMCDNALCPSKDYCYRFTAIPTPNRQSYVSFSPEDDEVNCSHFYPNGIDAMKCKLRGVKREGEMCNLEHCAYPKCVQSNYCTKCHQTDGIHKMGCETRKITIILSIALLLLTSCGSRNVNKEVTKTDSISKTVAVVRTDSVSKDSTSIKFDVETEEIVIEAVDSTQPIEIINNEGKVTKYKNARISKKKRKDNTIVVNEKTVSKIVVDSLTHEIEVQKVQSAKIVYKEQFNYSTLILSFWWLYFIIAVVVFLIYRYKKL
jgi:hypothetical protein